MKNAINLHCFIVGIIEIGGPSRIDKNGTDHSGAHAAYQVTTPDALHKVASGYSWVQRPSGRIISGKKYSLRMAANDFKLA